MSVTEKTIHMPQATLDKWLAALRSGEYKQAAHTLHDRTTNGYCCLGVLQMVVDGKVECDAAGSPHEVPSSDWLVNNSIRFNLALGEGFIDVEPYLPSCSMYATILNDEGTPFTDIADLIEKHAVGV